MRRVWVIVFVVACLLSAWAGLALADTLSEHLAGGDISISDVLVALEAIGFPSWAVVVLMIGMKMVKTFTDVSTEIADLNTKLTVLSSEMSLRVAALERHLFETVDPQLMGRARNGE